MEVSPVEVLVINTLYRQLAGSAAVYELRLRMLADMRSTTDHVTSRTNSSEVEKLIVKEYKLGPDEAKRLETTRELRNKVLHGAFREAKEKLADLGIVLPRGNVLQAKLSGDLSKFENDIANAMPVADGADDTIYGWLWESKASGFFPAAEAAFAESMKILDRCRDIASDPR